MILRRLQKLRSMSGEEIGARALTASYRVYERGLIASFRHRFARGHDNHLRRADAAGIAASQLLGSIRDLDEIRLLLRTEYPIESQESIDRADRALAGDVLLFGRFRQVGPEIDWHADPLSGRRWPLAYHRDVPVGDRTRAPGDPKDVWELNRHQWLLDLAKAWLLTGREQYGTAIQRAVHSWILANPYALGINWAGPLEVAYRALSWMWILAITRDRMAQDSDPRSEWLASLREHGRFLHRHLELFESPFNHLIGEAAVLYLLGTIFPGVPDAAAWRRRGRGILHSRLPQQFYSDGGSVEQAVGYHHATLGFYTLAALVGRSHGDEFSDDVWRALERAAEFSMRLSQPDGTQPAIGDNDDARPLAFHAPDTWDYRHFQAIGAVLFRRADFKSIAGGFPEDAFWLLGSQGLQDFRDLPAAPPDERSCALRASGYVVMRSGWHPGADYVCFDCGEQAGGLRTDDVPSAAHGHADALSVVVHLQGHPILVDPGFYSYNGDRIWERYFRETAAHNTARVDGRDQADHLEKMAWARVPRVELETYGTDVDQAWATASHDGYAKLAAAVIHRRTVWLRPDSYVILVDELTGHGEHVAEICFQFAAGLDAVVEEDAVRLGGRVALVWQATAALSPTLAIGGPAPDQGWIAPRLGSRQPAPRIVLRGRFTGALRVLSVLADTQVWDDRVPERLHAERTALAIRLKSSRWNDLVVASSGAPVSADGCTTDATIGVWRSGAGSLVEARRIGGTFMQPVTA